jgi:hypothetical protein
VYYFKCYPATAFVRHSFYLQNLHIAFTYRTYILRCSLKLSQPTILTSSLPFYPYQKDERVLPGYLLKSCSFPPLTYKAHFAFPQMFSLYFYSSAVLPDSLSYSLQWVNVMAIVFLNEVAS